MLVPMRIVIVLLLILPMAARAAPWDVVAEETRVTVRVPYLSSFVDMHFETVRGRVDFDARRPERADARIAVAAGDVETGLGIVNAFVRGERWLNVAEHPEILFHLDRLEQTTESTADVFGRITFLGVTRPVALEAEVFRYGPTPGADATFDAGFTLRGVIDRTDFGHTAGLPQVAAEFPVRIRLLMRSRE